jgi:transposase
LGRRTARSLPRGEDRRGPIAEHPDHDLFDGLPGAGQALAPRLATAFGSDRKRYESADEVQKFSGVAPVTEQSGKTKWVHWRMACPKFVRQTFHEFAAASCKKSLWARAYCQHQLKREPKSSV